MNTFQNTNAPTFSEQNPTKDENKNFPLSPPKTLQQLNLMDAFLFEAATEQDEGAVLIAKTIIERATGIKVDQIEIEREKPLNGVSIYNRGIRMDLYVKEQEVTEKGKKTFRVFDIEPNKYYEPYLPYRDRYCQAMIDSKLLPSGSDFLMPKLISIWILPYDPFGDDRMVYTVKNVVVENTNLDYNDGVLKIFLYTKGSKGGSKELKDLLKFLENTSESNAVDEELSNIQKHVTVVKNMEDMEKKYMYMTVQEMINYEKRDSFNEGIALGAKAVIQTVKSLHGDKAQARSSLIEQFSITESQADEYLNLYW